MRFPRKLKKKIKKADFKIVQYKAKNGHLQIWICRRIKGKHSVTKIGIESGNRTKEQTRELVNKIVKIDAKHDPANWIK